jgi:hypothetical protein
MKTSKKYSLKIKKMSVLKLAILWGFFSSIILAIVYNLFNLRLNLLFVKDLVIIIIVAVSFTLGRRINMIIFLVGVLLLYLGIQTGFTKAPILAVASSIRQIIVPFLFILLGYFLGAKADFVSIKRFTLNVGLLVLGFGFLEVYFEIWHFFDITSYFDAKNIPSYNESYPKFYNYPTFFIEPIMGGIMRMTSFLLDPINLGSTFVFLLALLFYDDSFKESKKKRIVLIIAFLLGLVLTFSKGAILQLIILFFIMSDRISLKVKYLTIAIFTGLLFLSRDLHPGIELHLVGLETAIKTISLFGHGLGQTGNLASMFGVQLVSISDTYAGSIIGQIGGFGYMLWILPFIYIFKYLNYNLTSKVIISQLLISIISENAFNFLSVFLVCVFIGIEYAQKELSLQNNNLV